MASITIEMILFECKAALGIPDESVDFDSLLKPKILAVMSFMRGAGVSEEKIISDLGVCTVVMGVSDIWQVNAGEIKFSPVFYTLVTQLSG